MTRIWQGTIFLLWASLLSVAGQTLKAPRATTEATSPVTSASRSDGMAGLAAGKSAVRYKLVFPTEREGGLGWKDALSDRGRISLIDSFVGQLNKAGAEGYRLISAISRLPIALVESGGTKYEYAWFDAVDGVGFDSKYEALASHGFRLVEELFWSESEYTERDTDKIVTETRLYYLFEREKGVEQSTQSVLLNIGPGGTTRAEFETRLNERLAEGFYPTEVVNFYMLLLEKAGGDDKLSRVVPQVRVFNFESGWYDDRKVREKVNALAQQGYRLDLSRGKVAVMHRSSGEVGSVKYIWVDAKKRDFEKTLAKLQEGGAVYRMAHTTDIFLRKTKLIFEQGSGRGGRHEYKVLKFYPETVKDPSGKRVNIKLTRASQEMLIVLNSLVQEGFRVRDLFDSDTVAVLLER